MSNKSVRNWWKAIERRVASFFSSVRTPLSGGNSRITRSDTLHEKLYIEIKARVNHSAVTLWRDTAEKAEKEKKIPVVVLAEKGKQGFWILVHSKHINPETIGATHERDRGDEPSN